MKQQRVGIPTLCFQASHSVGIIARPGGLRKAKKPILPYSSALSSESTKAALIFGQRPAEKNARSLSLPPGLGYNENRPDLSGNQYKGACAYDQGNSWQQRKR
jgi:hypothetical protein